ncbi:M15 family metallopeptidase [Orbus wheelerorum]|uniref:M15 family metallopeptidase n=1 Tax=Orbus wheelerorum TaxID=3074111 RepID=UPI00370DD0CD
MNAETLSQKQQRFSHMIGLLILFAYKQTGYGLTFGEAFRTPEMAAIYAQKGSGIKNSLHTERLAIDLNLFIDGVYQQDSQTYKLLGEYWESLGGTWGGRFNDGNHFSLAHNGRK